MKTWMNQPENSWKIEEPLYTDVASFDCGPCLCLAEVATNEAGQPLAWHEKERAGSATRAEAKANLLSIQPAKCYLLILTWVDAIKYARSAKNRIAHGLATFGLNISQDDLRTLTERDCMSSDY